MRKDRKDKLKTKLRNQSSYLRWSDKRLSDNFDVSERTVRAIRYELKSDGVTGKKEVNNNTLFIGDLHLPFTDSRALEFCKNLYAKWECNEVIFGGDIVDNHATSYYENSHNATNSTDELKQVINAIKPWYSTFPNAVVLIGNHDKLPIRRANSAGISQLWFREGKDVFETPNWEFKELHETDEYISLHGDMRGKNPVQKALKWGKSVIQFHWHSESYVRYENEGIFGMQVGCLVDKESWAFNYANSNSRDFILSCGILYNKTPIIETLI